MMRLAGFVTGSLAAIVLIVLILGVPEWRASEQSPTDTTAWQPPPGARPEVEAALPADPEPEAAPEPEPALLPEPEAETLAAPEPIEQPEPVADAARWHSFWSPFGSRIAADGFVSRLESVTGFDYRVLKIENGVYEVAFAYTDDREVDAMLSAIASATGLDLPDS